MSELTFRALPPVLLAWRRAIHCLEGVVAELAPQLCLEECLWRAGFAQLWREAPWRCFFPPYWKGFGSHLSTLELAEGAWRLCLAC